MSNAGNVVNLVQLMGTRYLANFISFKVGNALRNLPDDTVVDLADAKLGPDTYIEVVRSMPRLRFINSIDEKLMATLQEWYRDRSGIREPNMEVPTIKNWDDLLDYVKSFPKDKPYYKWPVSVDRNARFAIIVLILMYPQYQFDISNMYQYVFAALEDLGAPTEPMPIHVNFNNPAYLTTEMKAGTYSTVSSLFLCCQPIDLDCLEKHMFGKVIKNIQNKLTEKPYVSFVDVAKEQLHF